MITPLVIAAVVGYLLGSLPFGYLVARAKGVNIFEVGSKNPGATNVKRVLGAGPGNLVFFLDLLKGSAATIWPLLVWIKHSSADGHYYDHRISYPAAIAGLVGALLGHSFSCFTKFRGGKGVSTTIGGLLVLLPMETLIALVAWLIVFYASRYVSLASIVMAVALPIATLFLNPSRLLLWLTIAIGIFVIIRHRANIVRLLNGTENKFSKKKEAAP